MRTARLAWTQFTRDLAAGEVRIMLAALVLAVLAVTAVGFVTDRAERALATRLDALPAIKDVHTVNQARIAVGDIELF